MVKIESVTAEKIADMDKCHNYSTLQYLLVDKNIVLTTEANKLLIDLKKTYFFCKEN